MFSKTMFVGEGIIGILSYFNAENGIPVPTPSPRGLRACRCMWRSGGGLWRGGDECMGHSGKSRQQGHPQKQAWHGPGNICVSGTIS